MKHSTLASHDHSSENFIHSSGNTYAIPKPSRYTLPMDRRLNTGFTLIEAMVTLAIAAILVIMSTNLSGVFQNNQTSSYTQDLVSTLHYAKSEAITRNTRVTVCKRAISTDASDPPTCATDGRWDNGWYVFINANPSNNAIVSPDINLLRIHEPLKGGYTLSGNTPVADFVAFDSTGFPKTLSGTMQRGTLLLCDRRGYGPFARKITISSSGRIRAISGTDKDFDGVGDTSCPT